MLVDCPMLHEELKVIFLQKLEGRILLKKNEWLLKFPPVLLTFLRKPTHISYQEIEAQNSLI